MYVGIKHKNELDKICYFKAMETVEHLAIENTRVVKRGFKV